MKGYYIEVTNNLLEPKHCQIMGDSVWLFMWLLDRMTSISEQGVGKVNGGIPIRYEDVDDLGISERTYRRWVKILKDGGYINTKRTPYGLLITVNKAKKRFGQRDRPKMAHPDRPQLSGDRPRSSERYYGYGTSNYNKTRQDKDITKLSQEELRRLVQ